MVVRRGSDVNKVVVKDRVDDVVNSVRSLTQREILVGIPMATASREAEPGEKNLPPDNATLGYIHEFGSPAENIPDRPFLIPGVRDAVDEIVKRLSKAAIAAVDMKQEAVEAQLIAAGLTAQNSVRAKITDGPFVPLSPKTIQKRRSRKPPRTGTKPLLDTGQLRRSITYVIRDTDDASS